jgi:hypothetical protein
MKPGQKLNGKSIAITLKNITLSEKGQKIIIGLSE